MMTVAVIMITVVFEVGTHAIDHYAAHQPHIFQIVQRVYKELMLLGIISFGLFFFESLACLPPEFTHELHIIHILIFFISIAYIAEAIFILYVAGAVARRWTKIESISLMEYAALKMKLASYSETLQERNVFVRSMSWILMYKQHMVRASAAYQDARLQFVSCNRLPHDFNFALYLKRCIRTTFVDLLHIHWGIWCVCPHARMHGRTVSHALVRRNRTDTCMHKRAEAYPPTCACVPVRVLWLCVGARWRCSCSSTSSSPPLSSSPHVSPSRRPTRST